MVGSFPPDLGLCLKVYPALLNKLVKRFEEIIIGVHVADYQLVFAREGLKLGDGRSDELIGAVELVLLARSAGISVHV